MYVITSKSWNLFLYNLDLSTTETLLVHIVRDRQIRVSHEEKAAELEERVEDVLRQGQKDLQETRTKHKKELAKVGYALCNKTKRASTTTKSRLLYSTIAGGGVQSANNPEHIRITPELTLETPWVIVGKIWNWCLSGGKICNRRY